MHRAGSIRHGHGHAGRARAPSYTPCRGLAPDAGSHIGLRCGARLASIAGSGITINLVRVVLVQANGAWAIAYLGAQAGARCVAQWQAKGHDGWTEAIDLDARRDALTDTVHSGRYSWLSARRSREDIWIIQSNELIETVQLAGQREFAARALERDAKSLMQIGATLKRIDDGLIR